MAATGVRRPGIVTFIAVLIYIQAFFSVVAGIVGLAFRNRLDDYVVNGVQLSGDGVLWTSIWSLIVAVVLFAVASGLMRGSRGYRMVVAIVEGIHIAGAVGFMIYHHGGAYVETGLVSIAISLFVLWALFHERSDEFFEATG